MASCGGNFKVTVCFDTIRIVVPCGSGELRVKDLTELAVSRYRKAVGKASNYQVVIHNLRSSGDGILDQDDRLIDVVDDREQIIATFEEQDGPHSQHPGADGKSVSSTGTSSPDLFYVQNALYSRTTEFLGPLLSMEPVLLKSGSVPAHIDKVDSAHDDTICSLKTFDRIGSEDFIPKSSGLNDGAFKTLSRSSSRKSLCGSSTMQAWFDAQDKLQDKYEEDKRKDPVGSSDRAEIGDQGISDTVVGSKFFPSVISESWGKILLENDGSALGIHVVPGIDQDERSLGLLIQGIDPSGRIFRDGRLRVNDCIVEVNGVTLIDKDFNEAQEIFKQALQAPVMNLRIAFSDDAPPLPSHSLLFKPNMCRKPLPELPQDSDGPNTSTPSKELGEDETTPLKSEENLLLLNEAPSTPDKRAPSTVTKRAPTSVVKQAPSTVTKLVPPTFTKQAPSTCVKQTTRSDLNMLAASKQTYFSSTNLVPSSEVKRPQSSTLKQHMTPSLSGKGGPPQTPYSSTRKGTFVPLSTSRAVGKKLHVQLVKGNQGLGFSITTRDNTTGGDGVWPVYIKHILPQGAAITDGRLWPGDRLLEVNGIEISSKTQNEVVNYLRSIHVGSVVNLVISRQDVIDSELLVKSDENHNVPGFSDTDMFLFIIALRENGTESGLGISVKGKTGADDDGVPVDLGLFVKSVMDGGAAAKDGRLKEDDRLIEVNGHSLVGLLNSDAMEILRFALQTNGPEQGTVSMVIAREKFAQLVQKDQMESASNVYARLNDKLLSSRKLTDLDNGEKCTSQKESRNGRLNQSNWKSNRNVSYRQATHEGTLVESAVDVRENCCRDSISAEQKQCNNESDTKHQNDNAQGSSEAKTRGDLPPVSSVATPSHSANSAFRRTVSMLDDCAPTPPEWLPEWNKVNEDVTYMSSNASPMEVDPKKVFSRDAVGRQSMSEKRKGHVDPRTSSFYQQIKIAKAQNETQSTLKKAVSMESLLSQTTNLATPKIAARSCKTRESLKRYTSVENLGVTEKGLNSAVGPRVRIPNDSFKAAMDTSFKKPVTDCMEPVNEEMDAEPAGDVEKKKNRNPFRNLFRFGKTKKEEKSKTTEAEKEQKTQQLTTKIYDKPPNREAREEGTSEEKMDRIEHERRKRLSLAQSGSDVDFKLKESMRRGKHLTGEEDEKKPSRSCHMKNQTRDNQIHSCDYQHNDYRSFGGSTNYLDGPYNRRGLHCGCTSNDIGGYYVNCHDLQTQHRQYDSCQDPYHCCGIVQTPNPHTQCCSFPAHADPTFSENVLNLGGFYPGFMPNEPCDRRSQCLGHGGHGLPHGVLQTPQHYMPSSNGYPLQHPKTPMMSAHKATPSTVMQHHNGGDVYCQDQCCNTAYAIPRHQYHHPVDPRCTGTLPRKFVNPSAQQFDVQKV